MSAKRALLGKTFSPRPQNREFHSKAGTIKTISVAFLFPTIFSRAPSGTQIIAGEFLGPYKEVLQQGKNEAPRSKLRGMEPPLCRSQTRLHASARFASLSLSGRSRRRTPSIAAASCSVFWRRQIKGGAICQAGLKH